MQYDSFTPDDAELVVVGGIPAAAVLVPAIRLDGGRA